MQPTDAQQIAANIARQQRIAEAMTSPIVNRMVTGMDRQADDRRLRPDDDARNRAVRPAEAGER